MKVSDLLMLNVGHAIHDADWNFENVNSPFSRIYFVTEGEGKVRIDDTVHSLNPGNMYIIPAFTEHTDICDGHFEHYYVHVYEEISSGQQLLSQYDFPFEIRGTEFDLALFRNLSNHNKAMALKFADPRIYDNKNSLIECVRLNRERPLYDRLESAGIIYQFVGKFIHHAKPKFQISDPRIETALKTISANIHEVISVDTLARDACMTKDHFIRLFHKNVGLTPVQFIINDKMTKAQLMLSSENMSIKEIAYALGYFDISYFNRIFKKHTMMTPLQYRTSFNKSY